MFKRISAAENTLEHAVRVYSVLVNLGNVYITPEGELEIGAAEIHQYYDVLFAYHNWINADYPDCLVEN